MDEPTLQTWREALAEDPAGRDLTDLRGYGSDESPWRFDQMAHHLAQVSQHMLALGAGEGPLLHALADALPEDSVVSEGADEPAARLPFEDDRFDLVLALHVRVDPVEVFRVLAPGGTFATELVGPDDLHELRDLFDTAPDESAGRLETVEREIINAGFTVERSDAFRGRAMLADVPTLLRLVRRRHRIAPAGFTVDGAHDQLEKLDERLAEGPLELTSSRFWVLARTPEPTPPPTTDFSLLLDDVPQVPEV